MALHTNTPLSWGLENQRRKKNSGKQRQIKERNNKTDEQTGIKER
jgi:hypothetical protein